MEGDAWVWPCAASSLCSGSASPLCPSRMLMLLLARPQMLEAHV